MALSTWTYQGEKTEYKGMPVYPCPGGAQDTPALPFHAAHFGAELVITLSDTWVFSSDLMKKVPWVAWMPVDHDPVPPKVANRVRDGYGVPVAYSQFGVDRLRKAQFDPLYVPHGCHPAFFESVDKQTARAALDLPRDAYIVGMVGVNQSVPNRKSYPQSMMAFRRFLQKHNDAYLVLHTKTRVQHGLNLEQLAETIGLDKSRFRFSDQYQMTLGFDESYLRNLYSAMDVFLTPNMGEGFGLPLIEAQACGVPILGTNFSTFPELCAFGELIDGEPFYTNQSSFQCIPSVEGIVDGLEKIYDYSKDQYDTGSAKARQFIAENYHPDTVTREFWEPTLREAHKRIGEWRYPAMNFVSDTMETK